MLIVSHYLHAFLSLQQDQGETDGLQRFKTRSERLIELLVDSQIDLEAIGAAGSTTQSQSVELF